MVTHSCHSQLQSDDLVVTFLSLQHPINSRIIVVGFWDRHPELFAVVIEYLFVIDRISFCTGSFKNILVKTVIMAVTHSVTSLWCIKLFIFILEHLWFLNVY